MAGSGDIRDVGLILGSGRSPGEGNGNLLQYSCLENPVDRGAWWAIVHGVIYSRTQLNQLNLIIIRRVLTSSAVILDLSVLLALISFFRF